MNYAAGIDKIVDSGAGLPVSGVSVAACEAVLLHSPTEAETEAAIEAYRQKHGDGPIAVLTWDGEKYC